MAGPRLSLTTHIAESTDAQQRHFDLNAVKAKSLGLEVELMYGVLGQNL